MLVLFDQQSTPKNTFSKISDMTKSSRKTIYFRSCNQRKCLFDNQNSWLLHFWRPINYSARAVSVYQDTSKCIITLTWPLYTVCSFIFKSIEAWMFCSVILQLNVQLQQYISPAIKPTVSLCWNLRELLIQLHGHFGGCCCFWCCWIVLCYSQLYNL